MEDVLAITCRRAGCSRARRDQLVGEPVAEILLCGIAGQVLEAKHRQPDGLAAEDACESIDRASKDDAGAECQHDQRCGCRRPPSAAQPIPPGRPQRCRAAADALDRAVRVAAVRKAIRRVLSQTPFDDGAQRDRRFRRPLEPVEREDLREQLRHRRRHERRRAVHHLPE
jgi:hypothetical protein